MRSRLVELIGGRDDIVWAGLETLAGAAHCAADLLERRLHLGADDGASCRELASTALRSDATLRQLNRHLHAAFTAPLERDDALALGSAFDRVAQACAEIGAALDARSENRGRHEARRAASLLSEALEHLARALGALATSRPSGGAQAGARRTLTDGRELVRQGLADVLVAQDSPQQLLSWKDLYDRLDSALSAARDAERLLDALEPR